MTTPSDGETPDPGTPEQHRELARRQISGYEPKRRELMLDLERLPIGPTVARRLRSLARQELRSRQSRTVNPAWSSVKEAIPGLIVVQRYNGCDAFNASRYIADLDAAMRRAAGLLAMLEAGDQVEAWPRPIRPERGGLWLLDARYGSLDLLWTMYGSLVAAATSTPVTLASFTCLAWSSGKGVRKAGQWVVQTLTPGQLHQRPSASDYAEQDIGANGEIWHERTTKRLVPVFKQAINDGRGLDFRATGPGGELRLIVTPRVTAEAAAEEKKS